MSRHSLVCIPPPDLLLGLSQSAEPDRRIAVLRTLELDRSFRLPG